MKKHRGNMIIPTVSNHSQMVFGEPGYIEVILTSDIMEDTWRIMDNITIYYERKGTGL